MAIKFLLFVVVQFIFSAHAAAPAQHLVVGAGPAGLLMALKILETCNKHKLSCFVDILDSRDILLVGENGQENIRPQVLNMAFAAALSLPKEIRETLFEEDNSFNYFFSPQNEVNPRNGYGYLNVCVGKLQMEILKYLNLNYSAQFKLTTKTFTPAMYNNEAPIDENSDWRVTKYNAIIIATGNSNSTTALRTSDGADFLVSHEPEAESTHGMYLSFREKNIPSKFRLRNDSISGATLSFKSYDSNKHVQFYWVDESVLPHMDQLHNHGAFTSDPESRLKLSGIRNGTKVLDGDSDFQIVRDALKNEMKKENLNFPDNDNEIDVVHVIPKQKVYKKVALDKKFKDKTIPVIYISDAAGYTFYLYGISLARGHMCILFLVTAPSSNDAEPILNKTTLASTFQNYWTKIYPYQFESVEPCAVSSLDYEYYYKGRTYFNTKNGNQVEDLTETVYRDWCARFAPPNL